MNRFLIEVEHEGTKEACERAAKTLLATGSHFLTNAGWGCPDGEHKAWLIVDVETKEDAMMIVPHEYKNSAKVVSLEKFSLEDLETISARH